MIILLLFLFVFYSLVSLVNIIVADVSSLLILRRRDFRSSRRSILRQQW